MAASFPSTKPTFRLAIQGSPKELTGHYVRFPRTAKSQVLSEMAFWIDLGYMDLHSAGTSFTANLKRWPSPIYKCGCPSSASVSEFLRTSN